MYDVALTFLGIVSLGPAELGLLAICGASTGLALRQRRRERVAASDRVYAAYRKAMAEAGGAAV